MSTVLASMTIAQGPAEPPAKAPPKRVLIAEDNTVVRTVLDKQLKTLGYEVVECTDGKSALNLLTKDDGPSLAVIDWTMPEMSGVDVIKQVRQRVDQRYVYIIVLSAKTAKTDIISGLDAGADDYLLKPYDPQEMAARLRVGERVVRMYAEMARLVEEKLQSDRQRQSLTDAMVKRAPTESAKALPLPSANCTLSPKAQLAVAKLPEYVERSFEQFAIMGIKQLDKMPVEYSTPGSFVIYGNAMDVKNELWLDLWVELDRASAMAVFRTVMGNDTDSDDELLDFLGEIINLIQGFFKTEISSKGSRAITPMLPQRRKYEQVASAPLTGQVGTFYFGNEECKIKLAVRESHTPITIKPQDRLAVMDVLLEPFSNPSQPGVILVPDSTAMTPSILDRVHNLAWVKDHQHAGSISVLQPSPLAKFVIEKK